jgi:hypothetical protein
MLLPAVPEEMVEAMAWDAVGEGDDLHPKVV